MTLIMGFNLSDKVYVAGDSRLSYFENGNIRVRNDNMLKVEVLPGTEHITVASAGDARFARHILKKLSGTEFSKNGIAAICGNIEEWLKPVAEKYFTTNGYTNVTFIFGGTDDNSRKVINGAHWKAMANAYTGGKGAIFINSAVHKALSPGKPVPDDDLELDAKNTVLFSVQISTAGIQITETKWGEFLIYGQGSTLVKGDIELKDIASLELKPPLRQGDNQDGNAIALLCGIILSSAIKYNLTGVGGSVFALQNNMDGNVYFVTGRAQMYSLEKMEKVKEGDSLMPDLVSEIVVEDNKIYRIVGDEKYEMIPVSRYEPTNDSSQLTI